MNHEDIITNVLRAYQTYGTGGDCAGEWGAIRRRDRADFHAALASEDRAALEVMLFHPMGRREYQGLVSDSNLKHDLKLWASRVPAGSDPHALMEPDGYVFPDAPRHDAEACYLLNCASPTIIEIGGGYGGMAYRLVTRAPGIRYTDIDLADTLYLAYAFLASRLPHGAIGFEDATAPINLVPNRGGGSYPLPADAVAVNYRSFGEMVGWDVAAYFAYLGQLRPVMFIHENAALVLTSNPDAMALEYPEVLVKDFPVLDGYRLIWWERSPWYAGGGRYVRQAYRRT